MDKGIDFIPRTFWLILLLLPLNPEITHSMLGMPVMPVLQYRGNDIRCLNKCNSRWKSITLLLHIKKIVKKQHHKQLKNQHFTQQIFLMVSIS